MSDMRLAFVSSGSPAAEEAITELSRAHGSVDVAECDVIVALGAESRPDLVPGLAEHGHEEMVIGLALDGLEAAARELERAIAADPRDTDVPPDSELFEQFSFIDADDLPDYVWGDGDPAGVNARAIEEMKNTARAAQKFGVSVVNGFTGSSIWHLLYSYPPIPPGMIDDGFQLLAERFNPILDVFGECGVRFALEVHPTEIAFDLHTARRALEAIDHRDYFIRPSRASMVFHRDMLPRFHALHKQIGNPVSRIHIVSTTTFISGVSAQLQ